MKLRNGDQGRDGGNTCGIPIDNSAGKSRIAKTEAGTQNPFVREKVE